jgi:hypothetical protein
MKDLAPMPARKITAYYASLLIGLAVLLYFVPGQLFPQR